MDIEKNNGCKILGATGFFVQFALGILSFFVLIIKRSKEKPKRVWKIWALDTSKQGVSALLAHLLNVILAVILSREGTNDACVWYFITIMLDTTIGVLICYSVLTGLEWIFGQKGFQNFQSGNYITYQLDIGNGSRESKSNKNKNHLIKNNKLKPKIDYLVWFMQLMIWNLVVIFSKTLLYFLQTWLSDELESTGSFIFQKVDIAEVKLVIVMVIIPLIMNSFQFWIQDNFLKKNQLTRKEENMDLSKELYVDYEDILFNGPKNNSKLNRSLGGKVYTNKSFRIDSPKNNNENFDFDDNPDAI